MWSEAAWQTAEQGCPISAWRAFRNPQGTTGLGLPVSLYIMGDWGLPRLWHQSDAGKTSCWSLLDVLSHPTWQGRGDWASSNHEALMYTLLALQHCGKAFSLTQCSDGACHLPPKWKLQLTFVRMNKYLLLVNCALNIQYRKEHSEFVITARLLRLSTWTCFLSYCAWHFITTSYTLARRGFYDPTCRDRGKDPCRFFLRHIPKSQPFLSSFSYTAVHLYSIWVSAHR